MNVIVHTDNLIHYLTDPFQLECIAHFTNGKRYYSDINMHYKNMHDMTLDSGNPVSEEIAQIVWKKGDFKNLYIAIRNGNHAKDWDEVAVYSRDNLPLVHLKGEYREYLNRYGTIEIGPVPIKDNRIVQVLQAMGTPKHQEKASKYNGSYRIFA